MSPDSRSRMISFRLTAEEYDRFRDLCLLHGIRSVSEMARAAINLLFQQPARPPQDSLETRVAELEGRLHSLSQEFQRLHQNGSHPNGHLPTALNFSQSVGQ